MDVFSNCSHLSDRLCFGLGCRSCWQRSNKKDGETNRKETISIYIIPVRGKALWLHSIKAVRVKHELPTTEDTTK